MTRKNHIKKLDGIWSDKIRARDNFACQKCGEYGDSPHHIFRRAIMSTRFLLENGITLCYEDHIKFAHGNPHAFELWIKTKVDWDYLKMQSLLLKVDLDEAEEVLRSI